MALSQHQQVVLWSPPVRGAVLDLMVESAAVVVLTAGRMRRSVDAAARPLAALVLRPPVVGPQLQPATWLARMAQRGQLHRREAERELLHLLDRLVPLFVQTLLDRIDLNRLVRERLDLDGLVATVDIDAVVRRVDVEAILDRVDLDKIVRERVDVDGLVALVDVAALIDGLDLRALAEQVIAEVDLPEIIRASTGSVTSDTVRGVRMGSISGDDALTRAVDRLRLRRRHVGPSSAPETP